MFADASDVAKAKALDISATTLVTLSVKDHPGALLRILTPFNDAGVNIRRIESRPANSPSWDYDFFLTIEGRGTDDKMKRVLEAVQHECHTMTVDSAIEIPWFPKRIQDLDKFATRDLEYGASLDAEHPGFSDPTYRERRASITNIAKTFRHGSQIPRVDYTKEEVETWGVVWDNLMQLVPTHACREYQRFLPLLQERCGYSRNSIPQLEDVSQFLRECTGVTIRPVAGLLTSRDFLNALAHRVFHSTQYIRHHSRPLYTPEPDICHELLGHVPLFTDPAFADFSQEVGLASLGVSDEDVTKLATLYWFTVEFGVLKQGGSIRAYGAGILSSFGELTYCMGGDTVKPELREFNIENIVKTAYPITEYQPVYYVAESFHSMAEKVREYSKTLERPFAIKYNPYSQKVDIHDKPLVPADDY
eukprot:CAMPEP_0114554496 /NCGR_PEP_ID=MMETSP0114-20121206/8241_1 /TAXON_ID=31324 /ORGANISM="Goniomonas sp, Strain m" /LENGTH=418 /DNA_ID=CAMNT_0001739547 /DNA_START=120 /DNA_END=1376 /DNA_ORIENTATION=+